jgi:hypothetical protein
MSGRPHRLRISARRRKALPDVVRRRLPPGGQDVAVLWCECMADTNDQRRNPLARVSLGFWGFDYIAVIPLSQPAGPVFAQHIADAA